MALLCDFFIFLLPTVVVGAVLELDVRESIDVYKKSNGRKRISQLGPGDRVVISPYIYGKYRKVLITYKGKKRGGYIAIQDIVRSRIIPKGERFIDRGLYRNQRAFGVSTIIFHSQGGSQEIHGVDGDTYKVEGYKVYGASFALYGHLPLGRRKAFHTSVFSYSTKATGNIHSQDKLGQVREIDLIESQIGLKGVLKFYRPSSLSFWYGPALDLIFRRSLEFKVGNIEIETEEKGALFFAIVGAAIGWDIHLGGSIYLIPELKLGSTVGKKPSSINGELNLNTVWAF